jgi:hypothetical protein
MRFSPGCKCCGGACPYCSGTRPDTLYLTFLPGHWGSGAGCSAATCQSQFDGATPFALTYDAAFTTYCRWEYWGTSTCLYSGLTLRFGIRFWFDNLGYARLSLFVDDPGPPANAWVVATWAYNLGGTTTPCTPSSPITLTRNYSGGYGCTPPTYAYVSA